MDFGAPVAAGVQGPSAGIQTLSGLLGLKQQMLGLEQQKIAIAKQTIGVSQAQQELSQQTSQATQAAIHTKNLQGLQSVNWGAAPYVNEDGSPNLDAVTAKASEVGGADAPGFVTRFAEMGKEGAATKQAYYALNQTEQDNLRAAFGAWAADPNAQPADLAKQMEVNEKNAPSDDRENIAQLTRHSMSVITGPNLLTGAPKTLAQQKAAALAYARAGLAPSEVGGPSGLATPAVGMQATGQAIVPVAQSRTTGAVTPQPGALGTSVSPQVFTQQGTNRQFILQNGQMVPLPAGGGPIAAGGAPGQGGAAGAAPAASAAASPWLTQALTDPALLTANTHAFVQRVQAGESAANASPGAIDALTRSAAILDKGTWTGGAFSGFKDLKNLAASFGIDSAGAQNASELAKNIARFEGTRAGMVGDTDAARRLYETGAPNTKMDARAVKAVIYQSLGVEKMIQGYAKIVGGAPTLEAGLANEQKFRSIPHLVQAYELGFMKNQAQADDFLKRYDVSGKELAGSVAELRKLGAW